MMEKIKIIADCSCDLSEELIREYDISIVPMHIMIDKTAYSDCVDISPSEIYGWVEKNKYLPKTSAPSPGEIVEVFRKYEEQYDRFICFTISSELSSSIQSFQIAAQLCGIEEKVFVIDSRNLSTGIALLIIQAAQMVQSGMNASDITKQIQQLIPYVRTSFVTDSLSYLHKGGRCTAVESLFGSAMKIHPIIQVEDGKMIPGQKLRGNLDRVYEAYYQEIRKKLVSASKERVILTYSGRNEEEVSKLKERIENEYDFKEVLLAKTNCTIACHCGPKAMGIIYLADH